MGKTSKSTLIHAKIVQIQLEWGHGMSRQCSSVTLFSPQWLDFPFLIAGPLAERPPAPVRPEVGGQAIPRPGPPRPPRLLRGGHGRPGVQPPLRPLRAEAGGDGAGDHCGAGGGALQGGGEEGQVLLRGQGRVVSQDAHRSGHGTVYGNVAVLVIDTAMVNIREEL